MGRLQPPPCAPQMFLEGETAVGNALPCFLAMAGAPCPTTLRLAPLAAPSVSIITRLALRMFSGLSFTVMVSLYSATRSRSKGRFT